MLIEVTKDDIEEGVMEDECNCPLALAVARAAKYELPDDYMEPNIFAVVHDDEIQVYYQNPLNQEMDLQLDIEPKVKGEWQVISDFISRYDKGFDVEPFDMEFQVIQN